MMERIIRLSGMLFVISVRVVSSSETHAETVDHGATVKVKIHPPSSQLPETKGTRHLIINNLGPKAITFLAISPAKYLGWGCGPAWLFRSCNRLKKAIFFGQTAEVELRYSGNPCKYDIRFKTQDDDGKVYGLDLCATRSDRRNKPVVLRYRSSSGGVPCLSRDFHREIPVCIKPNPDWQKARVAVSPTSALSQ